jgi:hypothetical protein
VHVRRRQRLHSLTRTRSLLIHSFLPCSVINCPQTQNRLCSSATRQSREIYTPFRAFRRVGTKRIRINTTVCVGTIAPQAWFDSIKDQWPKRVHTVRAFPNAVQFSPVNRCTTDSG